MVVAALVVLALLTLGNYFLGERRIFYPPLLFCGVWLVDILLYYLLVGNSMPTIHPITWIIVSAGALAFTVGGVATYAIPSWLFHARIEGIYTTELKKNNFARYIMLGLVFLCTLAVAREAASLGSESGSFSLERVRANAVDAVAGSDTGVTENVASYICPEIATCITLCFLLERRDRWFWVSFALSCICFIGATGRTPFLKLFSSALAMELIRTKQDYVLPTLRKAAIPFLAFVFICTGLIFFNKDLTSFNGDIGGIISFYVVGYFVCALVPLDSVASAPSFHYGDTNHTFRFFNIILNQLGFDIPVKSVVQEYMWIPFNGVPFPTNVYTVYKFYLVDFGFWGMLLAIAVLGFLVTCLYQTAIRDGRVALLLSSTFVFPLLMAFFDDTFLQFRTILVFSSIAIVYFSLLKRLRFSKQSSLRLRVFPVPRHFNN